MNQEKATKLAQWIVSIIGIGLIFIIIFGIFISKLMDESTRERIEYERSLYTKKDLSVAEIDLLEKEVNINFPENSEISIARIFESRLEAQLDRIEDIGYFLNECFEKPEWYFFDSEIDEIVAYLEGKGTPQFITNYENMISHATISNLNNKQINNALTFTYSFYIAEKYTDDTVSITLYFDQGYYGAVISKDFVDNETLRNVFLKDERMSQGDGFMKNNFSQNSK